MTSSPASSPAPIRCGGPCCAPRPPRTYETKERRLKLAAYIAKQAQAIANDQIADGHQYAAVRRLVSDVDALRAWTPDDRP